MNSKMKLLIKTDTDQRPDTEISARYARSTMYAREQAVQKPDDTKISARYIKCTIYAGNQAVQKPDSPQDKVIASHTELIENLLKENDILKKEALQSNLCVVCMSRHRKYRVHSCGHVPVCLECLTNIMARRRGIYCHGIS